jgi:hypothetical protein
MGISGCVIVRDEADLLAGCLASLRPHVDEIVVVVDARGRDPRVREVAVAAGAVLRDAPDAGSHERSRDAYLEAATHDWILVLDADERLGGDPRAVVSGVPGRVLGFALPRFDYTGHGRWSSYRIVRLFRRHPAIRYDGSLAHSSVTSAIHGAGGVIAAASLPIHHLDLLIPGRQAEKRAARLAALRAQIAEGAPPFLHCFLGLELTARGAHDDAAREYHRAVELDARCAPFAGLLMAQQLAHLGELDAAAHALAPALRGSRGFRGRESAFALAAELADRRGDTARALALCRVALDEDPRSPSMWLNVAALTGDPAAAARGRALNPMLRDPQVFDRPRRPTCTHTNARSCRASTR